MTFPIASSLARPFSVRPAQILAFVAGVLALIFSAHLRWPWSPVPLTAQTLVLVLVAAIYGPRKALWVVGTYITLGVLAWASASPIQLLASNPAYTGGYLLGMCIVIYGIADLVEATQEEADESDISMREIYGDHASVAVLGLMFVLLCGWLWLGARVGWGTAFWQGVWPFLLPEALKALVAAGILTQFDYAIARLQRLV